MAGIIHTPLGSLNIIDVLVSFDGPRIFTCSNSVTKYLAFLVDELEESDHWLFVPVTNIRIQEIKNGLISIREALLNAEGDIVFQAFLPLVGGYEATIATMKTSEIPPGFLPQENSYILGQKDSTIQYYSDLPQKKTNAVDEARESARDVFDIALDMSDDPYEMESALFGETLINIQYTVFSLDERWSSSKKPPISVVEDNIVNVSTLFQSSFGIRIKSKRSADIFRVTPASKALRGFAELLQDSSDTDRLQIKLKSINPRAVLWYQKLLHTVKRTGSSLKAEWAAPNQDTLSVSLTKQQVDLAYEVTKQTEETVYQVTVKGTLYAVNLKRNTFFIEGEDGNEYSGGLSEDIQHFVQKGHVFHIPMNVEALIEVKVRMNLATSAENLVFTLLDVYSNDSDSK
ncbi:hypothetical protein D7Z26_16455 [Cohnella endophytica]|uniref:DUF6575 domain-containing protein n=1 Tax=Cohnella endophytica TaxID=2419778 RepID=A0A494XL95_9BACL|nr:DUF6575 domain-containing protein [Cohnella endophytica]RKP51388.1 hypothetical protein D7Z26_16455 [Cohnella endophytica]